MRFVSVGEVMVEMAPTDAGTYAMSFAGDTYNTAWYLAQLGSGIDVGYVSVVGHDMLSGKFLQSATTAGIDTQHVRRSEDRTLGLYLIELNEGERSFHYWRSVSAARTLADDRDRLGVAFDGADVIYFSGITLAILPPDGRTTLLDVLAAKRAAGCRIVFDPNLRPRLWADIDTMCAETMRAVAHVDFVLPSFDEEALFFGDKDPDASIARYQAAGATSVIVKNNAGTIHAVVDGMTVLHHPQPVNQVIDSTAAGDSFNAGFLTRYLADSDAKTAVAYGCDVSSHVIRHRGALVAI